MDTFDTRHQVEQLQIDYAYCIDSGHFEDWPEFFTDECVYQIISRDSYEQGHESGFYYCRSKNMLRDRVLALRETTIYEPQRYRHIIGGTRILESGDKRCRAESNLIVVRTLQAGEMGIFAAGAYLDTITFETGTPKFIEKVVVTDSPQIDMLLAGPL